MNSWLSQNSHSWSILPSFQWPIVAMASLNFFPVGGIVLPSPIGIGLENVPDMTPVTQVHSPDPNLMGCSLMLVSGAYTNMALRSSMCFAMPFVSCPSGHVTTMSSEWLSDNLSHFWLLNTS